MEEKHVLAAKGIFVLIVSLCIGTVAGVMIFLDSTGEQVAYNGDALGREEKSGLPSEPMAAPAPTSSGVLELKSYASEKYNFKFDYPANWHIYDEKAEDIFIQPEREKPKNLPIPHEGALEIKVSPVLPGTTLQEAIRKEKEEGADFDEEKIIIDNIIGIKSTTRVCQASECNVFEWFLIKSDYLYHFSSIYPDISYSENFDKIISSFKF